jgi:hypothetical protein
MPLMLLRDNCRDSFGQSASNSSTSVLFDMTFASLLTEPPESGQQISQQREAVGGVVVAQRDGRSQFDLAAERWLKVGMMP